MCFIVRVDIPVASFEEVVESKTDRHLTFGRNERKEAATYDDEVNAGRPENCSVKQDEFAQRRVITDVFFDGLNDGDSIMPVRVIRAMVPGDEEYGAELHELSTQEGKAVIPVQSDVANVAK